MRGMKSRTITLSLLVCLCAAGSCFADSFEGTWKLNRTKSKVAKGMGRNDTVVYGNAFPFRNKVTIDGTDAHGKPMHSEWAGYFDGHDFEVTGDATTDARAYQEVNDHTLNFWGKKSGKLVYSGQIVVSPDGKHRTVTTISTNARGKKVRTRAVYDKAG
jgi:hypothetical protein